MKLHPKSVLSFSHRYRIQVPDGEGIMLTKRAQNTSYQRLWFIFQGNLFSKEHQADSMPLGLIML